jgi:hypothetical protein
MRCIKLLGLAAVAALAVMAFVGAGSASATTLCKQNVGAKNECPLASVYPKSTTLQGHSTNFKVTFQEYSPITCSSDLKIETEGQNLGNPLKGQITSIEFSKCEGSTCAGPAAVYIPWATELQAAEGGGKLTASNGGGGNPELRFKNCIPPQHIDECAWGASKINFTLGEGAVPNLVVNQSLEKISGFVTCPKSITVSATYNITPNNTFEVSTSEFKISGTKGESLLTCGSSMKGELFGTISSLSLTGCKSFCSGAASALNLPYGTDSSGGKTMTVSSNPIFKFENCLPPFKVTCQWGAKSIQLDLSAGQIVASEEPLSREGGNSICPSSVNLSATYSGSVLSGLWVLLE